MNFPANPTLNQTYTYGSKTWKWDGTAWNLQIAGVAQATVALTGSFSDLVNKPTTLSGYGITDGGQSTTVIATNGIMLNSKTIASSYTIPVGYSAHSAGPMTISSGVTVTVAAGSRWVVL